MARIKGSKLASKIEFVRRVYGDPMVDDVVAALPPVDRPLIAAVTDVWYPSALYDRLVETICRVAAHGDEAVYDRMGAESAEHQLSHNYAAFRRSDLVKTLKNMVPMHAHMNDPGIMEVESDASHCLIKVTEPRSNAVTCRISRAFYRRVAELAGATGVQVSEKSCTANGADACRFVIEWDHA